MAGVTFTTTITFEARGRNTYAVCAVPEAAVRKLALERRDKFIATVRGRRTSVTVYTGGGRKVFLIPMKVMNELALGEGTTISVTLERPKPKK